jgi:hypothetical protein
MAHEAWEFETGYKKAWEFETGYSEARGHDGARGGAAEAARARRRLAAPRPERGFLGHALPEPRVPRISRGNLPRGVGGDAERARGRRVHRFRAEGNTEKVEGDGGVRDVISPQLDLRIGTGSPDRSDPSRALIGGVCRSW